MGFPLETPVATHRVTRIWHGNNNNSGLVAQQAMTIVQRFHQSRMDGVSRPRNEETCQVCLGTDEEPGSGLGGPWAAAKKGIANTVRGGKSSHSAISLGEERLTERLTDCPGPGGPLAAVRIQAWPRWRLAVNGSYSQSLAGPFRGPQGTPGAAQVARDAG